MGCGPHPVELAGMFKHIGAWFTRETPLVFHGITAGLTTLGAGVLSTLYVASDPTVDATFPAVAAWAQSVPHGPVHTVGLVLTMSGPLLAMIRAMLQAKDARAQNINANPTQGVTK